LLNSQIIVPPCHPLPLLPIHITDIMMSRREMSKCWMWIHVLLLCLLFSLEADSEPHPVLKDALQGSPIQKCKSGHRDIKEEVDTGRCVDCFATSSASGRSAKMVCGQISLMALIAVIMYILGLRSMCAKELSQRSRLLDEEQKSPNIETPPLHEEQNQGETCEHDENELLREASQSLIGDCTEENLTKHDEAIHSAHMIERSDRSTDTLTKENLSLHNELMEGHVTLTEDRLAEHTELQDRRHTHPIFRPKRNSLRLTCTTEGISRDHSVRDIVIRRVPLSLYRTEEAQQADESESSTTSTFAHCTKYCQRTREFQRFEDKESSLPDERKSGEQDSRGQSFGILGEACR